MTKNKNHIPCRVLAAYSDNHNREKERMVFHMSRDKTSEQEQKATREKAPTFNRKAEIMPDYRLMDTTICSCSLTINQKVL